MKGDFKMEKFEVYCNYGVLAAEKRNVYTELPHFRAVCWDRIIIETPEGWEAYKNCFDSTIIKSPWGQAYSINEILCDNDDGEPVFAALDRDMRSVVVPLKVVEYC